MRLIDYPTRDTLDGSEFLYAAKPGVGNSYKVTPTALTEFIFKQAGQLNNVQAQDARNASLITQSGEQAAVPYTAGLSMTSTLQRVSYLNDVYAPLGSAVTFNTSGTFEAAKFRRVAGVSGAALGLATGANIVGSPAPVAVPFLQTLGDIVNGSPVSILRFLNPATHSAIRAFTSTQDTSAGIQEAANSGAKRLVADYGLFNLEATVTPPGAIDLSGAGRGTIFHQRSVTGKASFAFNSADAATMVDGFSFKDFLIRCTDGTFAEQQHFFELSGVLNPLFLRLFCSGFRGDAIYMGSGLTGQERHNKNIQVIGCVFDGVNNQNRNAFTAIDGDGVTLAYNWFMRCTKSNMPGPIDFEPDAASYHVIRNLSIMHNHFRACGGNVGEVSIYLPAIVAAPTANITVSDNDSDGYVGTGGFFSHQTNRKPTATSPNTNIKLVRNVAKNGFRPYILADGKRVLFDTNTWEDMPREAFLSYSDASNGVKDALIQRDTFTRVGSVGGAGIAVFTVDRFKMRDVTFDDCGSGVAGAANAMDFNTGTSTYVDIKGMTVTSPTGKTQIAIQKEAAHTFTPATNSFFAGDLESLPNNFQAEQSDTLETAFTMPVAGQGTAGTWSPTLSFCRYRRVGKDVFGRAKLAGTLSGSGGAIMFGLPLPAQQDGSNQETEVTLTIDTSPTTGYSTGGQVGLITPALSLGGKAGVIRAYANATGVLTLLAAPAGAFTAYITFRYKTP